MAGRRDRGGDDEASAGIEAALYSAGRPLSMEELVRASGTKSRTKTASILLSLMKRTKSVFRALEVAMLPDGTYVFQLKPEYSGAARQYASRPMLPKATLKTLSYIALQQPISSKELVEARGSGAYAHVKELRQLDFVSHQSVGRFRIYSTTDKFRKYFGISGDPDELKRELIRRMRKAPRGRTAEAPVPAGTGAPGP
ncbi:transcriptional regulator containing HTH domain [Cenarchaeum symbiosum A]|uniref:Transcriptional regulator containing HTH domain n=1 Tax=Cenarchaeum symbiosum (strain A) TaxID=414004 RepID=A0RXG4_CENSY|nr:transcriptional regulator containing HTH domain [Cenarchaeum symbiosum A]